MKETPSQLPIQSFVMNFPFSLSTADPNNIWMQELTDKELIINRIRTLINNKDYEFNQSSRYEINESECIDDNNDDLVMTLVLFAWVATQKYFKDIVNHDIRKQIQLENMNQLDEEVLPAPIIDDGLGERYENMDGDLWEVADGSELYSKFIKDAMRNL